MKLSLLRHGEPVGGRMYRGNQDDPLTDKGWQQMLDSTQGKTWDYIATSPLLRCQDFANHLASEQSILCDSYSGFIELGFGDWQGKNSQQIGQDLVDNFKKDPINNQPPNAQNLYEFQQQVLSAFKDIHHKHSDKSVLIVAHAGVVRVIKSYLLNLEIEKMFTIEVMSASIEQFEL